MDRAGAPIEDAGLGESLDDGSARPEPGRAIDRGAVYAAMVGLGMAVTIAISFALVVAIQALVFLSAPFAGAIIGFYANHKSARWRPRWRLFANAGFAGLVTGLSLALMYAGLRLLFVYADTGYRPEPQGGQLECPTGPACTYARQLAEGYGDDLASGGITDAAAFESAVWRGQGESVLLLTVFTLGGALGAAAVRAVRPVPASAVLSSQEGDAAA